MSVINIKQIFLMDCVIKAKSFGVLLELLFQGI